MSAHQSKGSSIKFGQGGRAEIRVVPQYGTAGQIFKCYLVRFDLQKPVKISLVSPNGNIINTFIVPINNGGCVMDINTQNWQLGKYICKADGMSAEEKISVQTTFHIN